MDNRIYCNYNLNLHKDFEVVERKGIGHPDTLADALGERLSVAYSRYCLDHFGVILHHNFDKVGMMGGMSKVGFGVGKILSPIRVLINGRASSAFGDEAIDLRNLLEQEIHDFFAERFPHISDVSGIYKVMWEVSSGSSPGAVSSEDSYRQHWFQPRGKHDLSELVHLNCNDTSMGCAFYGNTEVERFVLTVEGRLNSAAFKVDKPWVGNDIKLMCCRFGKEVSLTLCVPQIGIFVQDFNEYLMHTEIIKEEIAAVAKEIIPEYSLVINLNMRDRFNVSEKDLYLTYTGSSIEMGDEGFVGRGNRFGGLITPNRFYSMEGIAGKNPVYHTGKMYSVFAYELSRQLYEQYGVRSESILVGMTGHALMDPHRIVVNMEGGEVSVAQVRQIIDALDPGTVTEQILNGQFNIY